MKDEVDGDLFARLGRGQVHVLGDRGTVRLRLEDVKRFDSGVVLLAYLPAS